MGLKKTLKHTSHICFCCHKKFINYNEKYIYRIDKDKGFKLNNMIILCEDCKLGLVKTKLNIWQLFFTNSFLDEYFNFTSMCSRKIIVAKMKRLKQKYDKKLKELEDLMND